MGQVARDLRIQRRERLLQNCLTALSVIKKKDILVTFSIKKRDEKDVLDVMT